MMRDIPHNMLEGVALHYYSVIDWNAKGPAVNFTPATIFCHHEGCAADGRAGNQTFSHHG